MRSSSKCRERKRLLVMGGVTALLCGALPVHALDREKASLAIARQAQEAYERADFARSETLYYEAWRTDPSKVAFVFMAARAAQIGGRGERAAALYQEYLDKSDADPRFRDKAKELLAEVKGEPKPAPVGSAPPQSARAAAPAPPSGVRTASAPPAPSRGSGWIALSAGVAGIVAGGVVYGMGASQDGDLEAKLAQRNDAGHVTGITQLDAQKASDDVIGKKRIGVGTAAVGAAVTAVGVWLLVRSPGATAQGPRLEVGAEGQVALAWGGRF
jgi:hypothetical protein